MTLRPRIDGIQKSRTSELGLRSTWSLRLRLTYKDEGKSDVFVSLTMIPPGYC